jgi:adenosylhomocysteine nucleosidase
LIGVIAALEREVSGLVRGWERRNLPGKKVVFVGRNAVVGCAGMGVGRASVAVEAVLGVGQISELISVGVAGACDPGLKVGDVVRAGVVVDAMTGERFEASQDRQVLVTGGSVASVGEKRRLWESYGASAVDMEAAAVARIARGHGLGFRAIKAISDAADFELQGLERFATKDGQFREAAFAMYAGVRPWMWGGVVRLGRNSGIAVKALTQALRGELGER